MSPEKPNSAEKTESLPPNMENLTKISIFEYSKNFFPLLHKYIERTDSPSSIYPLLGIKRSEFCVRSDSDGSIKFVTIETTPSKSLAANEIRGIATLHGGISATYIDACSGALANLLDSQKIATTTEHRSIKYKQVIKVDHPVQVISSLSHYSDTDGRMRRPIVLTQIFQDGKLCVSAETELALIGARSTS